MRRHGVDLSPNDKAAMSDLQNLALLLVADETASTATISSIETMDAGNPLQQSTISGVEPLHARSFVVEKGHQVNVSQMERAAATASTFVPRPHSEAPVPRPRGPSIAASTPAVSRQIAVQQAVSTGHPIVTFAPQEMMQSEAPLSADVQLGIGSVQPLPPQFMSMNLSQNAPRFECGPGGLVQSTVMNPGVGQIGMPPMQGCVQAPMAYYQQPVQNIGFCQPQQTFTPFAKNPPIYFSQPQIPPNINSNNLSAAKFTNLSS